MGDAVRVALQKGYDFIDIQSHGEEDKWLFRHNDSFTSNDAKHIVNPKYSIITTNACFVNSFDKRETYSNPSLSQALISDATNGVVGFLGSSRQGWGYGTDDLGPSQIYIGTFYNLLFANETEPKNFGKIVANIKRRLCRFTTTNPFYRWLQFSINPIGDPEMPINTTYLKSFNNVHYSISANTLRVNTGVDDCTICLTGTLNGEPYQKVFRHKTNVIFPVIPQKPVLCITKQNYIPYIVDTTTSNQSITQEQIATISSLVSSGNIIEVGIDSLDTSADGLLTLTDIMGNRKLSVPYNQHATYTIIETDCLASGVYILNLYIDNQLIDFKRVNIR